MIEYSIGAVLLVSALLSVVFVVGVHQSHTLTAIGALSMAGRITLATCLIAWMFSRAQQLLVWLGWAS